MNTNIFVTIHNLNALNQNTDMVIDIDEINGYLVLQPYDSTGKTPTQVWQLIPNLVQGCYSLGFTLFSQALMQSACNPVAQGQTVSLNDDPTPWGASSYCWTMFYLNTSSTNEDVMTIQDFQRGLCMNASGASIAAGTQVIMWPWEPTSNPLTNPFPNANASWILRVANAPQPNIMQK